VTVKAAVLDTPPDEAVRVTGVELSTPLGAITTDADVAPAGTVTCVAGTAAGLLPAIVTVCPPAGAAVASLIAPVTFPPPLIVVGDSVKEVSGTPMMVNVNALDVRPRAFETVTLADPAEVRLPAGTVAVNCVGVIVKRVSAEPFHRTWELALNPLPFTVSVMVALPELADDGLRDVSDAAAAGTTNRVIEEAGTVRLIPPEVTATSG